MWFIFRSGTASSGSYTVIEVTAALNLKIPAGSTLGTANSTPFRIWLAAFNNGGTVQLAVINCLAAGGGGANIYALRAWQIASISGYGGSANSPNILYSTSGAGGPAPYSVLGYATYEAGLATAGTYASAPTRLELWRPSVPLPGDVVKTLGTSAAPSTLFSSTSFAAMGVAQQIALSSNANVARIGAYGYGFGASAPVSGTFQIFRDSVAASGGQPIVIGAGAAVNEAFALGPLFDWPASSNWTGSPTYAIYGKGNGAGNFTFTNGGIVVDEIMA